VKRVVDIAISLIGLLVLFPFFLMIASIIKMTSSGEVFYRQERIGRFGKPFRIHKFRTMVCDADKRGPKLTVGNDARITSVGKFLRKYKIDELPQLIDVLQGTMSLVGPRPEVPEYIKYYPPAVREIVLSVKPGITDLASIMFKDENMILMNSSDPHKSYIEDILPQKLKCNVAYVDSITVLGDLGVIIKTIFAIIR
jgi:lipopolysaccharide/colanic/teichoic acid biosynthesis glycosyltransferase